MVPVVDLRSLFYYSQDEKALRFLETALVGACGNAARLKVDCSCYTSQEHVLKTTPAPRSTRSRCRLSRLSVWVACAKPLTKSESSAVATCARCNSVAIAGWRVSPKTKFARSHRTIMYVCPEQEPAALSVLTKFQLATGLPRLAIVLRSRHFWLAVLARAIYGEIARVMGSNMIPWSWVTAPHTGRRLMTQRVDVQSRCSSR